MLIIFLALSTASLGSASPGWPFETARFPAGGFYDCLYLYYVCTDKLGTWPENKQKCFQTFENCQTSIGNTDDDYDFQFLSTSQRPTNPIRPVATPTTAPTTTTIRPAPSTTQRPITTTTKKTTSTTASTTTTQRQTTTSTTTTITTTTAKQTTTTTKPPATTTSTTEKDVVVVTEPPLAESSQPEEPVIVRSCHDILKEGNTRTGIYKTTIGDQEKEVFCDMQSSGGGWTVLQRRGDFGNPPDHFFRNWTAYREGFGEAAKEIWLGLEAIYLLTNKEPVQLRIHLEDWEGNRTVIVVNEFKLSNEEGGYRIFYKNFKPALGKSLPSRGTKFSTVDRDNDSWSKNCAERFSGAWWYTACLNSCLNGLYLRGAHESFGDSIIWYHWKGYKYGLKSSNMKIKPLSGLPKPPTATPSTPSTPTTSKTRSLTSS